VIEIGAQVLHVDPPRPSSINPRVPRELDRIAMKALEKRPERRYQSAKAMIDDLRPAHAAVSHDTQPVRRIKDDLHRTEQPASARRTNRSSALMSITQTLSRKRVSLGSVLLAVTGLGLLIALFAYWWQPAPQKIPDEARIWYQKGVKALHSGAYNQASKAFGKAIEIEDKFAMARARLAEAQMEMGYADNARDEMLHALSLVPDRSMLDEMDGLHLEAINALVSNDFTRAIKAYERIVSLAPDDPQSYISLGRALEKNGELGKAIDNYVQATKLDPENALAYLRVGVLYGRQQNAASALSTFKKAEAIYSTLSDLEGQAQVHFERGSLLLNTGKLEEAEGELQQALKLANASGNDSQKISILLQLSRLYYTAGQPLKSQQHANEAITFAQQRGLDDLIALGLNNLGYAFFVSGKYQEAEENFNRAMEFARRNKSRLREAEILQNLSALYIQQLRTDEGLAYARQALAVFEPEGRRSNVYVSLLLIGRANRRKGDYEAALNAFQQLLGLAEQSNYPTQVAFSHGEIAMVLAMQERYPEALSRYDQAYAINKSLKSELGMAYNLMNSGNVLWKLGRYDDARAAFAQSEELAKQIKPVVAEVTLRYSEIFLSERRFSDAKLKSEQALALAGTQYEEVHVQAKSTLALAQAFLKSASEAKKRGQEAVEMAERAGDAALLSKALLALAEVLLESGDAEGALTNALKAVESFKRAGQLESEWRAWLLAARASRVKRDEVTAGNQLAQAREVLSRLRQRWGEEMFRTYLARPDIEFSHKQLGEAVPVADH
jgi:tetratricopeptide (TPR) repeat protein